jgi:hypothetical protein
MVTMAQPVSISISTPLKTPVLALVPQNHFKTY